MENIKTEPSTIPELSFMPVANGIGSVTNVPVTMSIQNPATVPITISGIPMGTLQPVSSIPGSNTVQFLMIRTDAHPQPTSPSALARILPVPMVAKVAPAQSIAAALTPNSNSSKASKFNQIFPLKQNKGPFNMPAPLPIPRTSSGNGIGLSIPPESKIASIKGIPPALPVNGIMRTKVSQSSSLARNAAAPLPSPRKPIQSSSKVTKKPQRKRGRGRGQTSTLYEDHKKELNEMQQKLRGKYERKPVLKKEDVGYNGPYIKTYRMEEEAKNSVPLANYIVDDFDTHLGNPSGPKSKYVFERITGVSLEEPLECFFCRADAATERERALGDLIGPIYVPSTEEASDQPSTSANSSNKEKKQAFFHSKCLEWSSNFRMTGYEIVDLLGLLEDAKTVCSVCGRNGATMGCSAPVSCEKCFHYPCALASNSRLERESRRIFCESHKVEVASR